MYSGIRWIDFGDIGVPLLFAGAMIAWFAPNTQQLFARFDPCLEKVRPSSSPTWLDWQPSLVWAVLLTACFCLCVLSMNRVSEFLYFQF